MVGASPLNVRPSYFVFKYLTERGYDVIPINPGQVGNSLLGKGLALEPYLASVVLGGGAFVNGEPIRCAAPASVDRAVVATGFGYDPVRRTRQAEVVARVIGQIA